MGCNSSKIVAVDLVQDYESIKNLIPFEQQKVKCNWEYFPIDGDNTIALNIHDRVRVIRLIHKISINEDIKCPMTYSSTRFVFPSHWSHSNQVWTNYLFRSPRDVWGIKQSSEIINDIKNNYSEDEELMDLVDYMSTNDNSSFVVRYECSKSK